LVPSINLLSQTVLAWANDAVVPLHTFAVCSDTKAGVRREDEDMSVNDLSFPASTDAVALLREITARADASHMTVAFSPYQSIDVVSPAQADGLMMFDLVICDEAHPPREHSKRWTISPLSRRSTTTTCSELHTACT